MTGSPPDLAPILSRSVFANGANRSFGALTLDDVRAHAAELRAGTGWGPMARVAPVARAWHELALELERCDAATVADLDSETLVRLAPQLWVILPG